MCISAAVSFSLSGALAVAGGACLHQAYKEDSRYALLAFFPLLVAVQQAAEGFVWLGLDRNDLALVRGSALFYLFFVWIIWPVWVPLMIRALERDCLRRRIFLIFALCGFVLGFVLYLPNYFHADWLQVAAVKRSIAYRCALLTDYYIPRPVTYVAYLSLIALPPLLSSQASLKIFGALLAAAIPITYLFFSYAHISVLCFMAALVTIYVVCVVARHSHVNKAAARDV